MTGTLSRYLASRKARSALLVAFLVALTVVAAFRTLAPGRGVSVPACWSMVIRQFPPGTALASQWSVDSPRDDATYDLTGVTSTAYPPSSDRNSSIFALGHGTAAARTCFVGGALNGTADDNQTWEYYHANYNAACLLLAATDWMQVRDLRCDNVEDGLRPRETVDNANNVSMYVSGTYFTRVRDDCLENDGVIGGVLYDNLWEQCNTGISERPSSAMGSWTSPPGETLTLDHMLIGLYQTPHAEGVGENALFKWSSSASKLVIKCSVFKVDAVSLNGRDAMKIPDGTVIDDSACPNHPSTIVWLGQGGYPAATAGLHVTTDVGVWDTAVAQWKCAHRYGRCSSPATSGSSVPATP